MNTAFGSRIDSQLCNLKTRLLVTEKFLWVYHELSKPEDRRISENRCAQKKFDEDTYKCDSR